MRWRSVLLVILVLVGLAIGWMFMLSGKGSSTRPTFAMPDGTRVQVEGVTFGTNHTFANGPPLLSGVRRFIPSPLRRWFGPPVSMSFNTTEETLIRGTIATIPRPILIRPVISGIS